MTLISLKERVCVWYYGCMQLASFLFFATPYHLLLRDFPLFYEGQCLSLSNLNVLFAVLWVLTRGAVLAFCADFCVFIRSSRESERD